MKKAISLRGEILKYAADYFGTLPDYPWNDEPDYAVLRHSENKKWYGLIMKIPKNRLGLSGDEPIDIMNVKCDPLMLGSLLEKEGCHPAYHMSKAHWLTVRLDGSVAAEEAETLLRMSYEMTAGRGSLAGGGGGAPAPRGAGAGAWEVKRKPCGGGVN